MKVYKEKQYLIFDFEDGRNVKYDFATQTTIGIKGVPVKNLQSQLKGIHIYELFDYCVDKQYAKFLSFVGRCENPYMINIGTILNRVPKYARFEQLFSAGIDDIIEDGKRFRYSINEIPKSLLKLCKTNSVKLSNNIVQFYKENPDAHYIAYSLNYLSLTNNDILSVWKKCTFINNGKCYYKSYFNNLVNDLGYNAKDLWLYIDRIKTFEAIDDVKFLICELCDYANMMSQLSHKYDKYPRNFLTTHKIASRNYLRMKKEFPENLFKNSLQIKSQG